MKFTIRPNMIPRELAAALPERLLSVAAGALLSEVPHTVIQFRLGSEPVRGRIAERAIRALDALPATGQPVLAVADELTRDAAAVLRARDIRILARGTDFWSDRSYEGVKTLIGSRVKKPDHR